MVTKVRSPSDSIFGIYWTALVLRTGIVRDGSRFGMLSNTSAGAQLPQPADKLVRYRHGGESALFYQ